MEVRTVKIICAWCKTELGEKTGQHIHDTHGMCKNCRNWVRKEAEVLEKIGSGFYDSETILNVTAGALLDDLRNQINQTGEGLNVTGM